MCINSMCETEMEMNNNSHLDCFFKAFYNKNRKEKCHSCSVNYHYETLSLLLFLILSEGGHPTHKYVQLMP